MDIILGQAWGSLESSTTKANVLTLVHCKQRLTVQLLSVCSRNIVPKRVKRSCGGIAFNECGALPYVILHLWQDRTKWQTWSAVERWTQTVGFENEGEPPRNCWVICDSVPVCLLSTACVRVPAAKVLAYHDTQCESSAASLSADTGQQGQRHERQSGVSQASDDSLGEDERAENMTELLDVPVVSGTKRQKLQLYESPTELRALTPT